MLLCFHTMYRVEGFGYVQYVGCRLLCCVSMHFYGADVNGAICRRAALHGAALPQAHTRQQEVDERLSLLEEQLAVKEKAIALMEADLKR